jgi:hypothetical protein
VPRRSALIAPSAQSFKDVPTEPGINTADFCEASEGLVKFFGGFFFPNIFVCMGE